MIRESSRVWDESGRVHQSPANHCASKYQMIRHRYAPRLRVGAVSPYRNYLSTMLPRPFMDLEWHKGKKHRRRFLSLLLSEPTGHYSVAIFPSKEDIESAS